MSLETRIIAASIIDYKLKLGKNLEQITENEAYSGSSVTAYCVTPEEISRLFLASTCIPVNIAFYASLKSSSIKGANGTANFFWL